MPQLWLVFVSVFSLVACLPAASEATAAPAREASAPIGSPFAAAQLPDPAAPLSAVRFAADRVLLRLSPAAAAAARVFPALRAASPSGAARLERLGLPGLDAAAARLGDTTFEREFPAERAPAPGSSLPDLTAFWIVRLPADVSREQALAAFAPLADVERAEPIAIVPVTAVPVDSLWSRAWYFQQSSRRDLHATEAWDFTTGDTSIVIAIIDTGIIPYHPDLGGATAGESGQIWTNWVEKAGVAGVDDDHNGFVDDVHGWDFVNLITSSGVMAGEDWRDVDNDPNDFAGHGTAVAGIVGALTNNGIGVTGTVWKTRLMPLRAGWASTLAPFGEVDLTFAAQAIVYATRNGASVINCSFASLSQGDLDAAVTAATAARVTVVTAAGNNNSPHGLSDRVDVISVAATDQDDKVALFSNRGSYVDLCAPGVSLATTLLARTGTDSIGQRQCTYTPGAAGTSFSAPLVAGAVALLQADRRAHGKPPLPPIMAQMRLRETSDDISDVNPTLTGYGDGRLNLLRALTDPPTSIAVRCGSRTIGPGIAVMGYSGHGYVVLAAFSGSLVALDPVSGDTLRVTPLPGLPLGGIAAADLGGGLGPALFVATNDGTISGFDLKGAALPGWPVRATLDYDGSPVEPALGDLDGDGVLEVVWGGNDGNVWAYAANGRRLTGFPHRVGASGRNVRIALSDLDGRAGVEIVAVTQGGAVHVLNGKGLELPGWPTAVATGPASPLVVRAPEDSTPEIVVAAGSVLHAFAANGSERWNSPLAAQAAEAPAAGDLDGDGTDDIVVPYVAYPSLSLFGADGVEVTSSGWPHMLLDAPIGPIGPPVIGALLGGRPGVIIAVGSGISNARLAAVSGAGKDLGGFPKPGRAGLDPTLGDFDADGHTEILAGAGTDSLLYVFDAGRGSFAAAAQSWPTTRGNSARTGSRLYTPAPPMFDDVPPAAVGDLHAPAVGAFSVRLRWSSPADLGPTGSAAGYELRRATYLLDELNFGSGVPVNGLPSPAVAGALDSAEVTGLAEDVAYFFALRSRDQAGNWSSLATLTATTAGERPAAVIDLRVALSSDSTVTLKWTATGDDGNRGRPKRYLIHAALQPLDEHSFDAAPIQIEHDAAVDAGGRESAAVRGLERARRYWFALLAVDAAGNRSSVSNVASAFTGPLGARAGIALGAGAQPAHAPVDLYWQGTSGGPLQRVRIYDVTGRLRRTLRLPGSSEGVMVWDGSDESGRALPAGLYFAQLSSGSLGARARIALLR